MSRVFYMQCQYNNREFWVAVDCQVHFPFSCIVLESYPSRISWYFICTNLVNSGASCVILQWRNTGKRMHCDLTLSSFNNKKISENMIIPSILYLR
jgi:hypothetical protein